MKLKNTSPLGALDIPLLGRIVEAGETFEITGEDAENLLRQTGNFERVDKPRPRDTHKDDAPSKLVGVHGPEIFAPTTGTITPAVAPTDTKEKTK